MSTSFGTLDLSNVELVGRDNELSILHDIYNQVRKASFTVGEGEELKEEAPTPPTDSSTATTTTTATNSTSRCRAVFVGGYSGAGKTSLVRTFVKTIKQEQRKHGENEQSQVLFGDGKYDLLARLRPFSGLVDAMDNLCSQIENPTKELGDQLKEQLGTNDVELLTTLVPSVNRLLVGGSGAGSGATVENRGGGSRPSPSSMVAPSGGGGRRRSSTSLLVDENSIARMKLAFQTLLRVIVNHANPKKDSTTVILHLDDLQWGDSATLEVIQFLLENSDGLTSSVMIIGCYRDNEVDDEHVLSFKLNELKQNTSESFQLIEIGELSKDNLRDMICGILHMDKDDDEENNNPNNLRTLSDTIHRKTNGNPFFTLQFLDLLEKKKLLVFNVMRCKWEWDTEEIKSEMDVTSNVVEMVATKILWLQHDTQRVLKIAACLGNRFDVSVVEMAAKDMNEKKTTDPATSSDKNDTTQASPSSLDLQKALVEAEKERFIDRDPMDSNVYRFAHDRVQQAAYCLISAEVAEGGTITTESLDMQEEGPIEVTEDHVEYHYHLGTVLTRLYDTSSDNDKVDWHLLVGTEQLNRAKGRIVSDPKARLELIKKNLSSAQEVRKKSAFFPAVQYLLAGVDLLGKDRWEEQYDLTLEISSMLSEMEFCTGHMAESAAYADEILQHSKSVEDRLASYKTKVKVLAASSKHAENLAYSSQIAKSLQYKLRKFTFFQMILSVMATKKALKKFSNDDILKLKMNTSKIDNALVDLLVDAHSSAIYDNNVPANVVIATHLLELTLKRGHTKHSPLIFGLWAITLNVLGDYQEANNYTKLSKQLFDIMMARPEMEQSMIEGECVYKLVLANFIGHFYNPLPEGQGILMQAYKSGMETGDITFALLSAFVGLKSRFWCGNPLEALIVDWKIIRQEMIDYKTLSSLVGTACFLQMATNLSKPCDKPSILEGDFIPDLKAFSEEAEAKYPGQTGYEIALTSMLLAYLFGDYDRAGVHAEVLLASKDEEFPLFWTQFYPSLRGLVWLALAKKESATKKQQQRYKTLAKKELVKSTKYAKAGFVNYPCMHLLLEAEMLTVKAASSKKKDIDVDDTIRSAYEKAINIASRSGFSLFASIGNERAAWYFYYRNNEVMNDDTTFYLAKLIPLLTEWNAAGVISHVISKYKLDQNASSSSLLSSALQNRSSGKHLKRMTVDETLSENHKDQDWIRGSLRTSTTSSTEIGKRASNGSRRM